MRNCWRCRRLLFYIQQFKVIKSHKENDVFIDVTIQHRINLSWENPPDNNDNKMSNSTRSFAQRCYIDSRGPFFLPPFNKAWISRVFQMGEKNNARSSSSLFHLLHGSFLMDHEVDLGRVKNGSHLVRRTGECIYTNFERKKFYIPVSPDGSNQSFQNV